MLNNAIPLLFAADDNYVKYLYVAILSLLENKRASTAYDIYILSPKKYKKNILNDFQRLTTKYKNVEIHYVQMGNLFDNKQDKKRILPSPSFYYLKIADIITNYDKAIYLDPDIIVMEDLSDLFNVDLGNNYVAGVKGACVITYQNSDKQYFDSIGLSDVTQYINANSLVFNLNLIRKEHITEKFCELSNNIYRTMDQDILNIVCYNKIKLLPIKYNLMVKYMPFDSNPTWSYDFLKRVYGEENLKEAENNPVVIHYANVGEKPWYVDTQLKDYWWKYAKLTPYYKEFIFKYYLKGKLAVKLKSFAKWIFSVRNSSLDKEKSYKYITILGLIIKLNRKHKG